MTVFLCQVNSFEWVVIVAVVQKVQYSDESISLENMTWISAECESSAAIDVHMNFCYALCYLSGLDQAL